MRPLNLSKPHLIIMIGIPGSGKSFFAEHFIDTFQVPFISTDQLRKQLFVSPTFSKTEETTINQVASYMLDELFKTSRSIIYIGQTDLRSERLALSKKAQLAGYVPLFVWVQTDPITAKKRSLKPDTDRPALTSDQFDTISSRFKSPHQSENAVVISGKHTYASQLRIVLKKLVEPCTTIPQPIINQPSSQRNVLIR